MAARGRWVQPRSAADPGPTARSRLTGTNARCGPGPKANRYDPAGAPSQPTVGAHGGGAHDRRLWARGQRLHDLHLTGQPGGGDGPSRPHDRPGPTTVPATTSPSVTSPPLSVSTSTVDPGLLPQTAAEPASGSALDTSLRVLWNAIVAGSR